MRWQHRQRRCSERGVSSLLFARPHEFMIAGPHQGQRQGQSHFGALRPNQSLQNRGPFRPGCNPRVRAREASSPGKNSAGLHPLGGIFGEQRGRVGAPPMILVKVHLRGRLKVNHSIVAQNLWRAEVFHARGHNPSWARWVRARGALAKCSSKSWEHLRSPWRRQPPAARETAGGRPAMLSFRFVQ